MEKLTCAQWIGMVKFLKKWKKQSDIQQITVTFIKADGSKRVMKCIQYDNTPRVEENKQESVKVKTRKPGPKHLINVFDVDINQYRKVNLKTIKELSI